MINSRRFASLCGREPNDLAAIRGRTPGPGAFVLSFGVFDEVTRSRRASPERGIAGKLLSSGMKGRKGSACVARPLFQRVCSSQIAAAANAFSRFRFAPTTDPSHAIHFPTRPADPPLGMGSFVVSSCRSMSFPSNRSAHVCAVVSRHPVHDLANAFEIGVLLRWIAALPYVKRDSVKPL